VLTQEFIEAPQDIHLLVFLAVRDREGHITTTDDIHETDAGNARRAILDLKPALACIVNGPNSQPVSSCIA
jgi:hypothetical protein